MNRLVSALLASAGRIISLDISSNSLGAAAVQLAIAALSHATTEATPLRLVLANVGLDDSATALLAQEVQQCGGSRRRLSLLDLFDNPLGDLGAAKLLHAVATCSQKAAQHQERLPVERLDLGCTNISDASGSALLAIVGIPSLRAIGLALTDLSAGLLKQLTEQQLVAVDIRGTVRRSQLALVMFSVCDVPSADMQHSSCKWICSPSICQTRARLIKRI